jgi:hypothetical protein
VPEKELENDIRIRGGLVAVETNGFCPSRYASIRTLGEPTLFGDSVHRMRSVFSDLSEALQSSYRSLLKRGWTKFAMAQSPQRSEAMGQQAAANTPLITISALW